MTFLSSTCCISFADLTWSSIQKNTFSQSLTLHDKLSFTLNIDIAFCCHWEYQKCLPTFASYIDLILAEYFAAATHISSYINCTLTEYFAALTHISPYIDTHLFLHWPYSGKLHFPMVGKHMSSLQMWPVLGASSPGRILRSPYTLNVLCSNMV